jgi:hypothetical protein
MLCRAWLRSLAGLLDHPKDAGCNGHQIVLRLIRVKIKPACVHQPEHKTNRHDHVAGDQGRGDQQSERNGIGEDRGSRSNLECAARRRFTHHAPLWTAAQITSSGSSLSLNLARNPRFRRRLCTAEHRVEAPSMIGGPQ